MKTFVSTLLLSAAVSTVVLGLSGCESTSLSESAASESRISGQFQMAASSASDLPRRNTGASVSANSLSITPATVAATPIGSTATVASSTTATRPSRGQTWDLVRWVSVAGVERGTSSVTYDALMSGRLTAAEEVSASRIDRSSELGFSYAGQTRPANSSELRSAIELEAAHFPELMRSRQFTREGDRMVVTGPGLLRFEFVRAK